MSGQGEGESEEGDAVAADVEVGIGEGLAGGGIDDGGCAFEWVLQPLEPISSRAGKVEVAPQLPADTERFWARNPVGVRVRFPVRFTPGRWGKARELLLALRVNWSADRLKEGRLTVCSRKDPGRRVTEGDTRETEAPLVLAWAWRDPLVILDKARLTVVPPRFIGWK